MVQPLLSGFSLDLQILICEFLHPTQILALRQTCKAFHEATSRRVVWIHALMRICHENSLFLPTFPIPDMSDAELECAATAPLRWIALSSSKVRNNDGVLPPRRTRFIKNPFALMLKVPDPTGGSDLYLVPGGRYLVTSTLDYLGVWDLGYCSDRDMSSNMKLWVAMAQYLANFCVHPTLDGLGIRILTYCPRPSDNVMYFRVFEIYPQKQTPELSQIAELILDLQDEDIAYSLNGNVAVILTKDTGRITVWDFKANTMADWHGGSCLLYQIIKVTKTAVIFRCANAGRGNSPESLWIFQIPPLTIHTSLFDDEDLPSIAPCLKIKLPQPPISSSKTPDSWYYFDDLSSPPFYYIDSKYGRRKLDITCDLSQASFVSTAKPETLRKYTNRGASMEYRICEDRFMSIYDHKRVSTCTTWTPSGTAVLTPLAIAHVDPRYFCPTSARLVRKEIDGDFVIFDFL
ncbi:hypothetical protein BYT27DRAFT_7172643 [Phlegmacium glaucopus]|nr:hypothetical protein BYT27DRAFT_7172643 [Phlegmacium glaucopus]